MHSFILLPSFSLGVLWTHQLRKDSKYLTVNSNLRKDPRVRNRVGVVRSRRFLGGVEVGFIATLGVGIGFSCPTPTQKSNWILFTSQSEVEIPVETEQFLLKRLSDQRFPAVNHDFHWLLIATKLLAAKLHYLPVKEMESGVGNFGKIGVGSRKFRKCWSRSRASESEIVETSDILFLTLQHWIPQGHKRQHPTSPKNMWRLGTHGKEAPRPPDSSTSGIPAYGRTQNLRETISMSLSPHRGLLPLSSFKNRRMSGSRLYF